MSKPYQIPQELEYYTSWQLPREALEEVINNQEKYTPELLKVLEHFIENYEEVVEDFDYMASLYTLFLLAQFREKRAYPLLIQLLSVPGDKLEYFLGDFVTEDLNRVIASVYDGNLDSIKRIIEDDTLNEYIRHAALYSLIVLYVNDKLEFDELTTYFKQLFDGKLPRKMTLSGHL